MDCGATGGALAVVTPESAISVSSGGTDAEAGDVLTAEVVEALAVTFEVGTTERG
jgi:hypothetical protein